jgi:hypothetical protein
MFKKSGEKIQVSLKSEKHKGTLHADQYTFLTISSAILLGMRNVSDKSCTENQNTHLLFYNFFFENRTVCAITWKNSMAHVLCILATDTLRTHNSYFFSTVTAVT